MPISILKLSALSIQISTPSMNKNEWKWINSVKREFAVSISVGNSEDRIRVVYFQWADTDRWSYFRKLLLWFSDLIFRIFHFLWLLDLLFVQFFLYINNWINLFKIILITSKPGMLQLVADFLVSQAKLMPEKKHHFLIQNKDCSHEQIVQLIYRMDPSMIEKIIYIPNMR